MLRARFDEFRDIQDPVKAKRLYDLGCEELENMSVPEEFYREFCTLFWIIV